MRLAVVFAVAMLFASANAALCTEPNNKCLNKNLFCFGKHRFRCPVGTRCATPAAGSTRSPCVGQAVSPTCPYGDFVCSSDTSYCHGGATFLCAPGTTCGGGAGIGLAPCRGDAPQGTCSAGEYACVSRTSFCQQGKSMPCPARTVCKGQAPCVTP